MPEATGDEHGRPGGNGAVLQCGRRYRLRLVAPDPAAAFPPRHLAGRFSRRLGQDLVGECAVGFAAAVWPRVHIDLPAGQVRVLLGEHRGQAQHCRVLRAAQVGTNHPDRSPGDHDQVDRCRAAAVRQGTGQSQDRMEAGQLRLIEPVRGVGSTGGSGIQQAERVHHRARGEAQRAEQLPHVLRIVRPDHEVAGLGARERAARPDRGDVGAGVRQLTYHLLAALLAGEHQPRTGRPHPLRQIHHRFLVPAPGGQVCPLRSIRRLTWAHRRCRLLVAGFDPVPAALERVRGQSDPARPAAVQRLPVRARPALPQPGHGGQQPLGRGLLLVRLHQQFHRDLLPAAAAMPNSAASRSATSWPAGWAVTSPNRTSSLVSAATSARSARYGPSASVSGVRLGCSPDGTSSATAARRSRHHCCGTVWVRHPQCDQRVVAVRLADDPPARIGQCGQRVVEVVAQHRPAHGDPAATLQVYATSASWSSGAHRDTAAVVPRRRTAP